MPERTHREVKNPQVSARYLAEFMAASQTAARTVIRKCKYQAIAPVVQHNEAKSIIAKFIRDGNTDLTSLKTESDKLRNRLADSQFDRDVYDHNADYIDRFAKISVSLNMPEAELLAPGKAGLIELNGVKVTTEIHFRLRRLTKTNKVRIGAGTLRYAKGKPLDPEEAAWQSAFLLGYLENTVPEAEAEPEHQLCITLDAYAGKCHAAPGNAVSRFKHMAAACATIAEWWPNIKPPKGAIY